MLNANFKNFILFFTFAALFTFGASASEAQTTEFIYQGRLLDNSMPPTANYDFEFRLFSAGTGGTPIGTLQRLSVPVSNGVFTVSLDFGAQFTGTARYLELAVKPAGSGGGFQQLLPRQPITSAPYSIRSLNSTSSDTATTANNSLQLGGIAASQYVLTNDARLSDDRNPSPGSPDYVQNRTTTQASTNFNISGSGSANILNAATQFNLGGNRILSTGGTDNIFVGQNTGASNTSGINNSFVGEFAGNSNATGTGNSFFGRNAGFNNISGDNNAFFGNGAGFNNKTDNNSFFGTQAGNQTSTGSNNSFFGYQAGFANTTGIANTFFGANAGKTNTIGCCNAYFGYRSGEISTGDSNSFFGNQTGQNNTSGRANSFFGDLAGMSNTTADGNSFFGSNAGQSNTVGSNNSFFGTLAGNANTSGVSNVFIGRSSGTNNTTGGSNTFAGFEAGKANTTAPNNSFFGSQAGLSNTTGAGNSFFGSGAGESSKTGDFNAFFGGVAGFANTAGDSNTLVGQSAGSNNTTGSNNVFVGRGSGLSNTTESFNTLIGYFANGAAGITNATAIGANAQVTTSNTMVLGDGNAAYVVDVTGKLQIDSLGTAGSTNLCLNGSNRVATCSSSLRYKTDVQSFSGGLDIVRRLRPISFVWRDNPNLRDVGFGAEEVEKTEPRLVTYRNGEIEGVKYAQLTTVLVNAVNEQQAQIEAQAKQIEQQRRQIEALKTLVCAQNPNAEICREQRP